MQTRDSHFIAQAKWILRRKRKDGSCCGLGALQAAHSGGPSVQTGLIGHIMPVAVVAVAGKILLIPRHLAPASFSFAALFARCWASSSPPFAWKIGTGPVWYSGLGGTLESCNVQRTMVSMLLLPPAFGKSFSAVAVWAESIPPLVLVAFITVGQAWAADDGRRHGRVFGKCTLLGAQFCPGLGNWARKGL